MPKPPEQITSGPPADLMDRIGRAIYERVFEDRWDDLPANGIERAMYRDAAAAAIDELKRAWEESR